MAQEHRPAGPDFAKGIALAEVADGAKVVGHVGDTQVLLVRRGADIFAIGAECTHYGGPLADGLVVDDTIRCPWHHACFDLRTGEALRAPALSPVACWSVEQRDGKVFVGEKRRVTSAQAPRSHPECSREDRDRRWRGSGFAAAQALRLAEYQGGIVMLSNDEASPVDRPNLSKDYLAGIAPEAWIPLRPDSSIRRTTSTCGSAWTSSASTRVCARSCSPTGAGFPTTDCCSPPAPSRFGCRSPEPICRMSARCARSPTAGRSSNLPGRRAGRW